MRTIALLIVALAGASAGAAHADPATSQPSDDEIQWGFGAQARRLFAPVTIQKMFIDGTPGYTYQNGVAFEFARRVKDFEFDIGVGYDKLDGKDGYYVEKGGDPTMSGNVDYVHFDHLRWYTVEFTFIAHARLHKLLELRYGAGLGAGIIRGQVLESDAICANPMDIQGSCILDPTGTKMNQPANIPPVLPVVNALIGFELIPVRFLHLHIDAGLHTAPYVSVGATLYLW